MTHPKRLLIHAMSPINAIAGICAAATLYRDEPPEVSVVVHYPGGSDRLAEELAAVVSTIVRGFPIVRRILSLPQSRYESLASDPGISLPEPAALRGALELDALDAWFYAHDVSGNLAPALAQAFPQARRVCFGDAMGQVFEKDVHLSYILNQAPAPAPSDQAPAGITRRLARWLRGRSVAAASPRPSLRGSLVPDEAVLILPVDESGAFLPQTRLTICPRPLAREIVATAAAGCSELRAHIAALLAAGEGRNRCLLLSENWAECGAMEFATELELYASLVEAHCPPGAAVYVKPHPGEEHERIPVLRDRLGGRYEVIDVGREFRRYPIELWPELVQASTVISTMYPALSLKYLYDIEVIQPMDDAFIERWMPQRMWAAFKNSLAINMVPLGRLPRWDGASVLYSGDPSL